MLCDRRRTMVVQAKERQGASSSAIARRMNAVSSANIGSQRPSAHSPDSADCWPPDASAAAVAAVRHARNSANCSLTPCTCSCEARAELRSYEECYSILRTGVRGATVVQRIARQWQDTNRAHRLRDVGGHVPVLLTRLTSAAARRVLRLELVADAARRPDSPAEAHSGDWAVCRVRLGRDRRRLRVGRRAVELVTRGARRGALPHVELRQYTCTRATDAGRRGGGGRRV